MTCWWQRGGTSGGCAQDTVEAPVGFGCNSGNGMELARLMAGSAGCWVPCVAPSSLIGLSNDGVSMPTTWLSNFSIGSKEARQQTPRARRTSTTDMMIGTVRPVAHASATTMIQVVLLCSVRCSVWWALLLRLLLLAPPLWLLPWLLLLLLL
mmetsp:Transcript_16306/g.36531  ORF Transcript_16306/g.36531 Transcript_16306/m.36531 type:complete len:152 (+) Transcript_16306:490-945(+)